jgi:hypothetical protein
MWCDIAMREILEARPINPRDPNATAATLSFVKTSSARLHRGYEPKELVDGLLNDRPFSGVERCRNEPPLLAQRFINAWCELKKSELPVPDNLYRLGSTFDQKYTSLLVPNVVAEGGAVYGKGLQRERGRNAPPQSARDRQHDQEFLEVTNPVNCTEVAERVHGLADFATRRCIDLPHDDPMEMIVYNDGQPWHLMVLDLSNGGRATGPMESISRGNQMSAEKFLRDLAILRMLIEEQM